MKSHQHLFPFFENILLNGDYDKFIKTIDEKRSSFLNCKKELITREETILDFKSIGIPNDGLFSVKIQDIKMQCFFIKKNVKKLYVILNGYLAGNKPEFKRWSWHPFIDGCMLNIADPMFDTFTDLRLGWYYGTTNVNYRHYVCKLVLKLAANLDIEREDIIFYGSSGGGTAAIYCGKILDGCTVVAINPQIRLSTFSYASAFEKSTGINLKCEDAPFYRNDVSRHLATNSNTNYIILQNIRCAYDMNEICYLENKLGLSLKYGLTAKNNIMFWLYDADTKILDPHNAQENYCIYFIIRKLIYGLKHNHDITKHDELIQSVNEFWHYQSKVEENLRLTNHSLKILEFNCDIDCIPNNAFKTLASYDNFTIEPKDCAYNHRVVWSKFTPHTIYTLHIDSSIALQGSTENLLVGARNVKHLELSRFKLFALNTKVNFTFVTSAFINNPIELRVYPNQGLKTAGVSIACINLKLFEIGKTLIG